LERIKTRIEKVVPSVKVTHQKETAKLQVSAPGAVIKVEVNTVNRGLLGEPVQMTLSKKAQKDFDAFVTMNVVPLSQLYGGKLCAALDRQHPRDLFDVKYLLQNEGITEEIKQGFLFLLLCNDRPINEVLYPNFQDQRQAMDNQFSGMSDEDFSYAEYEETREQLVSAIRKSLTEKDKQFLLGVKNLTPDWTVYNFERFPAIAWKLQNLKKLRDTNPGKHQELYEELKSKLNEY
jgi:predicted nucleotidyltransferase component of viral defense system